VSMGLTHDPSDHRAPEALRGRPLQQLEVVDDDASDGLPGGVLGDRASVALDVGQLGHV
jgi:hypothetical protein